MGVGVWIIFATIVVGACYLDHLKRKLKDDFGRRLWVVVISAVVGVVWIYTLIPYQVHAP